MWCSPHGHATLPASPHTMQFGGKQCLQKARTASLPTGLASRTRERGQSGAAWARREFGATKNIYFRTGRYRIHRTWLVLWKMKRRRWTRSIVDAVHQAIADATARGRETGCFLGRAAMGGNTEPDAFAKLIRRDQRPVWRTIDASLDPAMQYAETDTLYRQDETLFNEAMQIAFGEEDALGKLIDGLGAVQERSRHAAFMLSKVPGGNMTWHVDGGGAAKTDLVVYFVLGPATSRSVFHCLVGGSLLDSFDDENIAVPTPARLEEGVQRCPVPSEFGPGVKCYSYAAKAGDVVVFDGSSLHGVANVGGAGPQLALAVNFAKGTLDGIAPRRTPLVRLTSNRWLPDHLKLVVPPE